MNNALELTNLNKDYDTFRLSEITFELPSGYIMGFIGPNGAGKTTTIKLILDLVRSDYGSVNIFGQEKSSSSNEDIGVVMDTPFYVGEWTSNDVERVVAPFYRQWNSMRFASLLKQFSIDSKKKINELSRGMKVKLQIATALSHNAKLLILDEPTSGLDVVARDEICDLLREFISDENKSVLFSTHITSDLEKIADYITFILNGKVVFTGTKDDLLERYVRVTGGVEDINRFQRDSIIGYREYQNGFEGMMEISGIRYLPEGVLTEKVNLEEIIVFMNKGVMIDD